MRETSEGGGFTFSDLFAGVGGFHAALHAAGGHWVFASEIDEDARAVYDYNWLRPLREVGAPLPPGVDKFAVSGDIRELTEPRVQVPKSDVLAAGFPCQPFSKSGHQRGMSETRGTLFWNIARILQHESSRPAVVLLENVRNLAGPRHRRTTFVTIVETLRQLGYRTADEPAVISPHLLPPALGGRPQARDRVFIAAHYVGSRAAQARDAHDQPIVQPSDLRALWCKYDWDLARDLPLQHDRDVEAKYELDSADIKFIETWDRLLTEIAGTLERDERLPGFPIWLEALRPRVTIEAEIAAAGIEMPEWKQKFLRRNAEFYERHRVVIDRYRPLMDAFPASRRKFEWQAGKHRPLAQTILQLRPSGIRCKLPDYAPALVAINQASLLGDRRRITPREAARLQGFPDWFEFAQAAGGQTFRQRDPASYMQMGNAVNVGVAYFVFRRYVLRHASEIASQASGVVEAVMAAPEHPYDVLGTRASGVTL